MKTCKIRNFTRQEQLAELITKIEMLPINAQNLNRFAKYQPVPGEQTSIIINILINKNRLR